MCGKNAIRSKTVIEPCLLRKGHGGKHKHSEVCNDVQCGCGAMKYRMNIEQRVRYDILGELSRACRLLQDELLEGVKK